MQPLAVDKYDVHILNEIQNDGRLSRVELSERINLSPSQCYRRLKRMEDAGLIERYIALVNRELAGFDISAMVMIGFEPSVADARNKAIALFQSLDQILEAHGTTGDYDFILKVCCPNMKAFTHLITKQLQVEYLGSMHSYLMMDCVKLKTALAIKADR